MARLMKLIIRLKVSLLCLTRWWGSKTLKNDFVRNYCYLTNISGYFFFYNKITINLYIYICCVCVCSRMICWIKHCLDRQCLLNANTRSGYLGKGEAKIELEMCQHCRCAPVHVKLFSSFILPLAIFQRCEVIFVLLVLSQVGHPFTSSLCPKIFQLRVIVPLFGVPGYTPNKWLYSRANTPYWLYCVGYSFLI